MIAVAALSHFSGRSVILTDFGSGLRSLDPDWLRLKLKLPRHGVRILPELIFRHPEMIQQRMHEFDGNQFIAMILAVEILHRTTGVGKECVAFLRADEVHCAGRSGWAGDQVDLMKGR